MASVNMPTSAPARKVVGATTGAGIGGVTANLVLWALDDTVFQPKVQNSVPEAVSAFVLIAVPAVLAFVGGYVTRRQADELIAPAKVEPAPVVPDAPAVVEPKPAAKKTPAKRAAKKAAPKPPDGLS